MPGALLSTSAGPRSPLSALAIPPRGQGAPNVRLALLLWQVPATCKHCFLHIIFSDCLQWEGWCTISEPAVTESGNPPRGIYIGKCDELGTENWVEKKKTTTTREREYSGRQDCLARGNTGWRLCSLSLPLSYA